MIGHIRKGYDAAETELSEYLGGTVRYRNVFHLQTGCKGYDGN